ncbi:MAG: secondary thiamine-phosphate synthase enzyme YjbQ [Oscillospiraceae bacterium]|jgi:secondary thiamine-phosphate synthase enzyme|nr:secondary thiamine-phosphate synthase enzyme YjbQ [Oscillospiraceae bacterium]
MIYPFSLSTPRENLYDITPQVREAVSKSNVTEGVAIVFCPHTTAGITINENSDPDVITDFLFGLDKAFPDRKEFRHDEGNSSAHLKSSSIGPSETIIIQNSDLVLGTWQSIYFCEFDPPRNRIFYVKVM